jgi:hypothetical protein
MSEEGYAIWAGGSGEGGSVFEQEVLDGGGERGEEPRGISVGREQGVVEDTGPGGEGGQIVVSGVRNRISMGW